jgi:hypothetical protein
VLFGDSQEPKLTEFRRLAARQACCGVVSNGCCDVSAPRATVFKLSAPPPPPKPAIACTSWAA